MWKCPKCETTNDGEFCMICGHQKVIAPPVTEAPPAAPTGGGYGWNFGSSSGTPDLEPNYNPHTGRVDPTPTPTYNPYGGGYTAAPTPKPYVNPYVARDDLPPTYAPHAPYGAAYPTYGAPKGMKGGVRAVIIIAMILAIITFLVLPIMSAKVSYGYYSYQTYTREIVVGDFIDNIFENMFDDIGNFGIVLTLAGALTAIIGAAVGKKGAAITGAVLGLLGILMFLGRMMDAGADIDDLFEVLDIGFYLPVASFITGLIGASTSK